MIDFDVIVEKEALTIIRRIRPCKLAFFLPDRLDKAVEFILWNSIIWGGAHNIAIPCSSTKVLTEKWKKIIDCFEPDQFINLGCSDHEFFETLRKIYEIVPSELRSKPDCVTMHGLVTAIKRLNRPFNVNPIFGCSKERNKRYYLPTIATTGLVDESILPSLLQSDPFKNIGYLDLLGARLCHTKLNLEAFNSYLKIAKRSYDVQYTLSKDVEMIFAKRITSRDLRLHLHRTSLGPTPDSLGDHILWNSQHAKFLVLVIGDTQSIPDLCLYWNLLSVYQNYSVPVFWVNKEDVANEKNARSLMVYANWPDRIYLASTSLTEDPVISNILRKVHKSATVEFRHIDEFFTPGFSISRRDFPAICPVHDRRINVLYPRDEMMENIPVSYQYRVEFDVKLDALNNYQLPQVTRLRRNLRRRGFVEAARTQMPPTSEIFSERFPDSWTIIEAVFASERLSVEPSNHGLKAMGILNLFKKPQELAILSMETFNNLVELFNRPGTFLSWHQLHNSLRGDGYYNIDKDFTDNLLIWLVKRKILARYFPVQCPLCHTNQYIPVGNIAETIRCEGCFEEILTPLGREVCYGMNKRFCSEIREQGALLPLLTLGYFTKYRPRSALAFYPGIDVNLKESPLGTKFNKETKEVDIVFISPNTSLTLAECKWDLASLKDEEIDFYFTLAKMLNVELLFSTMSDLNELKDQVKAIKQRAKTNKVEVNIIGQGDLLNFSYYYCALGREWLRTPTVKEKREQHINLIQRLIKL